MDTTVTGGADAPVESLLTATKASVPDRLSILLPKPVPGLDGLISLLEVREPRVHELISAMRSADQSAGLVDPDTALVAAVSNLVPGTAGLLNIRSFRQATRFLDDLYADGAGEAPGDQPDELVVTLIEPVSAVIGDETKWCESYTLREPTVREWKEIDRKSGVERDVEAVRIIAKVDIEFIRQFRLRDLTRGARYIAGFFD